MFAKGATMVIIVMGVSGSGKTTVGEKLATKLKWVFYDGDDFHPPTNVDKMSRGIPLSDEDRHSWLLSLRALIERVEANGENGVIASSALKESYRQILSQGEGEVVVVFLRGSYELILERMEARPNHFMKADMLQSQFAALEAPMDAITIDISLPPEKIVEIIISHLPSLANG
jgi:gluconokinase